MKSADKQKSFSCRILVNRFSAWSVILLVTQQLIVASSTYWIAQLSTDIVQKNSFAVSLVGFIGSLIVVFLPSSFSGILLNRARWLALEKYVEQFTENFYGNATLRSNQQLKQQRSAYLSNESYLVIEEGSKFLYDWLATSLNVFFNIVAISIVIERQFVFAYVISFVLVFLFVKLNRKNTYQKSSDFQQARLGLQQILSSAWENILVGNPHSYKLWQTQYSRNIEDTQKKSNLSEVWNLASSSIGMILAMIPVFLLVGHYFNKHTNQPAALAVLVATLPRQIQILQYAHVVIYYATSWTALRAKLDGLNSSLFLSKKSELKGQIAFEKIKIFSGHKKDAFQTEGTSEFASHLKEKSHGRLTIRGPNGAGKSTLLNQLKENFGQSAFLLTAHSQQQFKTVTENASTGQTLVHQLNEIYTDVKVPLLLLDEWDANLDSQIQASLNTRIEEMAQKILIVEVRHREDSLV